MDTLRDLELLIESRYPIIAVQTLEEDRLEQVLQRVASKLDIVFAVWTITDGLRPPTGNPFPDTKHPVKALSTLRELKGEGLFYFKDLHRYLNEPEVLRRLQDVAQSFARRRGGIVLSASQVDLPPEVWRLAAFFRLDLPTVEDLRALIKEVVSQLSRRHRIKVELSDAESSRLVESLNGLTLFEAERALSRVILDDLALTGRDAGLISEIKKDVLMREALLEYAALEEGMGQIGGLAALKAWLEKRKQAFTPEAGRFGITPPKGILLLGVQGCGKSLAAKAVAREWGLPLLRLEPGRLYDKYIGESEKNLERALSVAEHMAPCVLMVDEVEKAFAYGGDAESDAGLSRRVLGRLLTWLQDRKAPVFVVCTCNDIEALPPELLRKGRFDETFFIDLPAAADRKAIFAIHLRRRDRDPAAFDLDELASAAEGFSGAEIEQAIVSALYTAFAEGTDLRTEHILREIRATRPLSVLRQEAIAGLRQWAEGRTVMAG